MLAIFLVNYFSAEWCFLFEKLTLNVGYFFHIYSVQLKGYIDTISQDELT